MKRFRLQRQYHVVMVILLIATCFMLARPYRGIRHDAVLYAAQALYHAHPQNFRYDLFFQFGSQDQWSLFGRLYQTLIGVMGLKDANAIGLLVSTALWWTGIWQLSRQILPTPWRWIALVFIASLSGEYGDGYVFSYGETFLTGRLPAEALSFWALALALRRGTSSTAAAIVLAAMAMSLHPLMGAVGFIAVAFLVWPRFPWWRAYIVALGIFAASQYLTSPNFAMQPFDGVWRNIIRHEMAYLLPTEWRALSWSRACWVIALPLALSAVDTTDLARRRWHLLALLGTAGLSFATVADLAGHDAIWIQLQLWRAQWLLTVTQWLAIPALVVACWIERRPLLWLFAICWLLVEAGGGGFIALACAVFLVIEQGDARRRQRCGSTPRQPILSVLTRPYRIALSLLTVMALAGWTVFQTIHADSLASYWLGVSPFDWRVLGSLQYTQFMVVPAALLCALHRRATPRAQSILTVTVLMLFAYALWGFDQRTPTMSAMELRLDQPQSAPFAGRVAAGKSVYWDGPEEEIVYPWLLMRTASYYSAAQTSGIIFHRQTTFEQARREALVRGTGRHDDLPALPVGNDGALDADKSMAQRNRPVFIPLGRADILRVCADPELAYLVSTQDFPGMTTGPAWRPIPGEAFWLYDCAQLTQTK